MRRYMGILKGIMPLQQSRYCALRKRDQPPGNFQFPRRAAETCAHALRFRCVKAGARGQSPLESHFSQLFLGGSISRVTLACFATGQVMKVLPPITAPSPITVSPPRMVALA